MNNKIKFALGISLISIITMLYLTNIKRVIKEDKIILTAQTLSNSKFTRNFTSYNYFKNRDIRNKYKGIQINIENKSNSDYLLETDNIGLKLADSKKISKMLRVKSSLSPLATIGAACSLFIFGLGFAYVPAVVAGGTIGASTNLLNIKHSNEKLKNNIKNRSIDPLHGILIPSCQTTNTIFFLKKEDLKPNFTVSLEEIKTGVKREYCIKTIL